MFKSVFVTCHGMFAESPGYSSSWIEALGRRQDASFKEFYWETVNDKKEKTFIKLLKTLAMLGLGGGLTQFLYIRLDELNDVVNYRSRKKAAIAEHKSFLKNLIDRGHNITVLAHSLGSVLTYETVAEMTLEQQAKITLVTFGSPLCKKLMRKFLGVKDQHLFVKSWFNFTGLDDPITIFGSPIEKFSSISRSHNIITRNTHDPLKYLNNMKNYSVLID